MNSTMHEVLILCLQSIIYVIHTCLLMIMHLSCTLPSILKVDNNKDIITLNLEANREGSSMLYS